MMSKAKRDRCTNWETDEKKLLKEIIIPYMRTIENKDLSTSTNKAKKRAWLEIANKFNSINFRVRDKKHLINQWKSMKVNSKKDVSKFNISSAETGRSDSRPPSSTSSQETQEIFPIDFVVDCSKFGSEDGANIQTENRKINNSAKFDSSEASFKDLHDYRELENQRQQTEHILRIKMMAEQHNQLMINLKLQEEILRKQLE